MINFDAVDFSVCCSEETCDKFLLMLSVPCYKRYWLVFSKGN